MIDVPSSEFDRGFLVESGTQINYIFRSAEHQRTLSRQSSSSLMAICYDREGQNHGYVIRVATHSELLQSMPLAGAELSSRRIIDYRQSDSVSVSG